MGKGFDESGKWAYNRDNSAAALKVTCGCQEKERMESQEENGRWRPWKNWEVSPVRGFVILGIILKGKATFLSLIYLC